MARKLINLNESFIDGFTILFYGLWASGKTFILGDMLAEERKHGEIRFVNTQGEDGWKAISSFQLGNVGEEWSSYEHFLEFCKEYSGKKLQALGVDQIGLLSKFVCKKVVGSDRLPKLDRNSPTNEWGEYHREMDNAMAMLRNTAKFIGCVCPADRSVNAINQKTYISPDLPGRQAVASAGWFDFAGYLEASVTPRPGGQTEVSRVFSIAPSNTYVVKQRLAKQIMEDIKLPTGPGGWRTIKDKIIAHSTL